MMLIRPEHHAAPAQHHQHSDGSRPAAGARPGRSQRAIARELSIGRRKVKHIIDHAT